MTLKELAYLVAVADHGHFGHAANACHVSQPTLSTQLKKLEDRLGVTLVERNHKRVHLTPVGEQILVKAREVLAGAHDIVEIAQSQTSELVGAFNLGIIPTLSPYVLPWLAPLLDKHFSQLNLIVYEDITEQLVGKLKQRKLDALLLALPVEGQSLQSVALFNEPFLFACHKSHRFNRLSKVSRSHLQRENLLLLNEGHCLREQALDVCGMPSNDNRSGPDFRASSLETIKQMVQAGWGVTLLPSLAAQKNVNSQVCFKPLAKSAYRQIGLVWRSGFPKNKELVHLAQIIKQNLPDCVFQS